MPSLRSIFTLQDNYSRSMDRIWTSTQRATSEIDRASAAVDHVNSKFTATESSAGRLTSRLTGLAAAFLSIQTIKKGMEISDTYTNISSKLSLITSNAAQLKSLQNDIFAAADRARGSYTDMADTVARLGITAGSQFGSNQNIVKFAETMQKMFRVGGASTAEQSAAMLQITQAIGSGKLQGDEFRSIMENAPMAAQAIAKYLGTSTDKLKELSTDGKLTSDVIISGVLSASKSVDQQVSKMSYTWGDYWNKIKNGAYQAFGAVFENESSVLGSQKFQKMIDGIIASFSTLASAANQVLTIISDVGSYFSDNWSWVSPIIWGIVGALVALTVATWAQSAAQAVLNLVMAANPIGLIIIGITLLIVAIYETVNAINQATGSTISATGLITGAFNVLGGLIYNNIAIGYNAVAAFVNFLNHAFQNPIAAVEALFLDLAAVVNSALLNVAQNLETILNKIPGVKVDFTSALSNFQNTITSNSAKIKNEAGLKDIIQPMQLRTISDTWNSGYKFGNSIDSKVNNWMENLGQALSPKTSPTPKTPIPVTGTGADGSVKVNIADQDLQYLRDLAEKQYINKFSTAVLSPKLSVSFSGNVGDKNDQQQIYFTISKMLQEELATAAEGLYE